MSIFDHRSQRDPQQSHLPPRDAELTELPYRVLTLLLLGILILPAGCSKEEIKAKLKEAQDKVEAVAESTVQAVEERLPESGSVALQMTPAVEKTGTADVELISIGDGRPNVVQIITYDPSATTRSYPSIMLHGTTDATSASALSGDTIECDMYFQASYDTPIAMTKPGGSVAVKFGAFNAEDNALTATFGMTQLLGSDDRSVQIAGGDIVAVVRGQENGR